MDAGDGVQDDVYHESYVHEEPLVLAICWPGSEVASQFPGQFARFSSIAEPQALVPVPQPHW